MTDRHSPAAYVFLTSLQLLRVKPLVHSRLANKLCVGLHAQLGLHAKLVSIHHNLSSLIPTSHFFFLT